jgi:polyisoprenoid-binding protein YceI
MTTGNSLIMKLYRIYHILFIFALFGCTKQPKGDMAKIGDPQQADHLDEGIRYEIDTVNSIVTWVGTKPSGRHNGIFKIKEGYITVSKKDSQQVENKSSQFAYRLNNAEIIIDLRTVDILDLKHNPDEYDELLDHLKSKDFFHVQKYPEARFELDSCEKIEKDSTEREENELTNIDPTHIMKGNLTFRGNTESVKFPVRLDMRNLKLEASAKFTINRTSWNINFLDKNDPVAWTKDSYINNIVNVGFEILAFSTEL